MRRIASLSLISCVACGGGLGSAESPIIGGEASSDTDFPSTGAILARMAIDGFGEFGSFMCTGTLIAPDVVLTAAHCVEDQLGGMGTTTLYFTFARDVAAYGNPSMVLPARTATVERAIKHPSYAGMTATPTPGLGQWNDIGLMFLETSVTDVVPSIVADAQDGASIAVGVPVDIAGYGQRTTTDQAAGVMYHAVSVVNEAGAHEMQIGITSPDTPQKCHGDSGGPTFLDVLDGDIQLDGGFDDQSLREQQLVLPLEARRHVAVVADERRRVDLEEVRRKALHTKNGKAARRFGLRIVACPDL